VAAVADEELASLGIQEVLMHLDPAGIDAAVVTEPTERQAGTAHPPYSTDQKAKAPTPTPNGSAAPAPAPPPPSSPS